MAKQRFRNSSEAAYAEHLTRAGLSFQYEKLWGSHNPDFTIAKRGADANTEPIAIADVKNLNLSDAEEALLEAGEMISIERNPAEKTRRQIRYVWPQFEACSGYPCVLVLAPGTDHLPEPIYVVAAMLGDYTISIPVSTADDRAPSITQSLGEHGAMVNDKGNPMNTRISAIGLMSAIRPGELQAGVTGLTEELRDRFLSEGTSEAAIAQFLTAYEELRNRLTAEGYDLESVVTQVEYVVNPLAAQPFPKADLSHGCVKVWEYSLATQTLGMTYDWAQFRKLDNGG